MSPQYFVKWENSAVTQRMQEPAVFNSPTQVVDWLEFKAPFQHKYGYVRDERVPHIFEPNNTASVDLVNKKCIMK